MYFCNSVDILAISLFSSFVWDRPVFFYIFIKKKKGGIWQQAVQQNPKEGNRERKNGGNE